MANGVPYNLFSREAWLAFIAHAAMAFVVIAPVGYAAANYVAKQEADRAVRQATDELRPTITEIERHQAVLSTELRHLKDDINTLSSQNEKILEKLEKLDERLDGR